MFVMMEQAWNGLPCGKIAEVLDGVAIDLFERGIATSLDAAGREKAEQLLAKRENMAKARAGKKRKAAERSKAMTAPPRNKMVAEQKMK